jgi:hypothetical protein
MWVMVDRRTGIPHPITLEDHYENVAHLQLNESVPEEIQDHFTTAVHLGLYSWFVYRFTMASQQHAYATLEWALRERLGSHRGKHRKTFSELFREAVQTGVLKGVAFRQWSAIGGDPKNEKAADDWISGLAEAIPSLRNDLAHGSFTLAPMHWMVLGFVADAINQLYPLTDATPEVH